MSGFYFFFCCFFFFQVFQFKCPSALNCCTFLSENEAAGGTEDGTLWLIDIRFPRLVSFNTRQQRTRLFIFWAFKRNILLNKIHHHVVVRPFVEGAYHAL